MGINRSWSTQEVEYLNDHWGQVAIPFMAKKLNRTINAIKIKKNKLGLGTFLESWEYATFNQFLEAIGCGGGYSYKAISWIKNRDFPIHKKRVNKCRFKIIYITEFWKWAEKNQDILDFSKFEENNLGEEPTWVKEKRKRDFKQNTIFKNSPWTPIEDSKLMNLLSQQKYGYADLSKILYRTSGAIQRRCLDLNIKDRPVKADNHIPWTQEKIKRLEEMIKAGWKYPLMALELNCSDKAVRGYVYRMFNTENLDKVRMLVKDKESGFLNLEKGELL